MEFGGRNTNGRQAEFDRPALVARRW